MKKILLLFIIFIISAIFCYGQNASTYFPANTGYKWYFKNTPLDSNNNPVTSLINYRIDSFAVVANYQGLLASIVLTKNNLTNFNQNAPYTDTSFYNFQTTNAWSYLQPNQFPDTFPLIGYVNFLNFLKTLQNWYNYYRFAQTVNLQYTIFTKDTTVTIDTLTLPLRVSLKGKRMNDEVVNTVYGNYNTKKFILTAGISYLIQLPPPLPPLEVPIVQRPDTMWFAQSIWLVKEVIPSVNISLSAIGIPVNIPIPGVIMELANPSINIKKIGTEIPSDYYLEQNYPNPFNQSTIIKFRFPVNSFIELKIFDISGKEIKTLTSSNMNAGLYEILFNASNLSSGIYYYRLTAGNYSLVKKMGITK